MKENKSKKKDNRCDECRFYDIGTQRDFFRKIGKRNEKGERTKIKEIRAKCVNPKSTAYRHLVKADSINKPCFKKLKSNKKADEEKTSPEEYFGAPPAVEKLETMSAEKVKSRKEGSL